MPVKNYETIHNAVALKQRNPLRFNHPGKSRVRKTVLQRSRAREGMNDISHGAEPDNEKTLDWRGQAPV